MRLIYSCFEMVGSYGVIIIIIIILRVFHSSVSRWFSTEIWETASLLESPGLLFVFWPILIILKSRWSPLVLSFPSPPVSLSILGDCTERTNYNMYHRHFHVPVLKQGPGPYLYNHYCHYYICTHTHTHTHIYIYIFKIGRSTKRFAFFEFIYFVLTYVLFICMFPACCFRQRICMAQGLLNEVLNETWYIYIYIYCHPLSSNEIWYIYINCHPQTDCFVISQLFIVARHVGRFARMLNPRERSIYTGPFVLWVECLQMIRETGFRSHVESY